MSLLLRPLRDFHRRILRKVAPGPVDWFRAYRQRWRFCRAFRFDQRVFKEAFYPGNLRPEILTGPFRGMRYLDEVVWGPITPKWAGAYEMELHDLVAGFAAAGYDRIINIGCAEGYYAVGLALLDSNATLYALDFDPCARLQVRRLARVNGVSERIHVQGRCTVRRLNRLITAGTLIVCDVEGEEAALIDPVKVPRLNQADILVEVHESTLDATATIQNLITNRLLASHEIECRVWSGRESWMEEHRSIWEGKVSPGRMMKSLDEARSGPQVCLWAKSKLHADSPIHDPDER